MKKIKRVLISAYEKSSLKNLIKTFDKYQIEIISTGGTKNALEKMGANVKSVESITEYPSILGGRVKTLHPKIFGGILNRPDVKLDQEDLSKFDILDIDMVIIDLYPFQDTVKKHATEDDIIEKIDIGGVSLIRAAAKNYKNVLIIPSIEYYEIANKLIIEKNGFCDLNDRLLFAQRAFSITQNYESHISNYFDRKINPNKKLPETFKQNILQSKQLRYGENPHQTGIYYGNLDDLFDQLSGKELSYNNLLDIDAAMHLMHEFKEPSFGILKHNNACGFCSNSNLEIAWENALAGDPISAFGGVLITNDTINLSIAQKINNLFFEILIANSFSKDALDLLKSKSKRIILKKKNVNLEGLSFRTILNGVLCQEQDFITDNDNLKTVSKLNVSKNQMTDLIFASKICKHTKSNAIVLVKDKQLLASGCGQTSRVDALNQAIVKAKSFGFSLKGAVMASDAFFPFPDCVEIAHKEGINAVIQPGGSKNDKLSIDYCDKNNMTMLMTETRHFKH